MTLSARITGFLATAYHPSNLYSARDKLEQAIALLQEVADASD